uniref:ECRG4 augurin precursor b n=1 Tax=Cyprinus carpio TaxID=7962 RepID=A0A8C2FXP5_CYPCA
FQPTIISINEIDITDNFICLLVLGGSSGSRLQRILMNHDGEMMSLEARPKAQITLSQSKAKEFLSVFHRFKRKVWDQSHPDVQQWIQQFMYMGYDEARLETDLSYWMDQARSNDQGQQRHHDENSTMSQQDPSSYRHRANANYY